MESWEKERVERAKERKVSDVLQYFVREHNRSGLKYSCSYEIVPEATLRDQIHFYLVREGFKWVEASGCFVGVTERIYEDAKEIVSSALRRYSDIVKEVGTVGIISLEEEGKIIRGREGKLIRLVI